MLADINLDKENFEELVEEAKHMIASYYPEWTDFNYHDPGITLCELFAFFKEIAQYRMNFIGERHLDKYLKLLGMRPMPARPARVHVSVDCESSQVLPALTRFYAPGVCFESVRSACILAGDLKGCLCEAAGSYTYFDRQRLKMTNALRISPFGPQAPKGACFYMVTDAPMKTQLPLAIYAGVWGGYPIKRNPIGPQDSFFPLAKMQLEYYTDQGWMVCASLNDGTYGFLQSGRLEFVLDRPMAQTSVHDTCGYYVRLRLTEADYDVAPVLSCISMNMVEAVQTCHLARCQDVDCTVSDRHSHCRLELNELNVQNIAVLEAMDGGWRIFEDYTVQRVDRFLELSLSPGENGQPPEHIRVLSWEDRFDPSQIAGIGNGLPCQEFSLDDVSIYGGGVKIMVEAPDRDGLLMPWEPVADFDCSGAESRHYRLDVRQKKLVFGDCIHGMAPEGRILITEFATCEGAGGNVKENKIDRMEEGYPDMTVINHNNAWGGQDEETPAERFMKAKQALRFGGGLVTDEDYETAVRRTPGLMIESCKAIYPGGGHEGSARGKTLVVKPYGREKHPRLGRPYLKNIYGWLEERRMIGTDIRLVSPEYVKLNVFVECRGRNNYMFDREAIIRALNKYFHKFSVEFGGMISHSSIYELLDRLENIEVMEAFSMDAQGNQVTRNGNGDILLPPGGLLDMGEIQYNISMN